MLRLFRNLLVLASVLQVGTAVQAQQQPAKAKTPTPAVAKAPTPDVSKAAKKESAVVSPIKAAAPPIPAKKAEPTASKVLKTETPAPSKSAKTEAPAASKSAKVEVTTASKSTKTATSKTAKTEEKVVPSKHNSAPRLGLVPPPPPDTPTMFAGDSIFPGFGMSDFNNPAVLAGRRKDVASQLASAKKMLADKEVRSKELKDKAVQFEQLFSEGVISRRELESAQKDAASAATELNDAKTQAVAYQNAISRLDDRIKPKSVAAKKNAKGKIKASTKSAVKVAGTSTSTAKSAKESGRNTTQTTSSTATSASSPGTSATSPSTNASSTAPGASSNSDSSTTSAQANIKAAPGP